MQKETVNEFIDTKDAQHRVLSALVLVDDNAKVYAHAVAREMFDPLERKVLDVIRKMVDQGLKLDVSTILAGAQMRLGVQSAMEIGTMLLRAENPRMCETYVALLEEGYRAQRLQEFALKTQDALKAGAETGSLTESMQSGLLRIASVGKKEATYTAGDIIQARAQREEQRRKDAELGKSAPKYGIAGMDTMTRGMVKQRVSMLAARPSMGKTVFGLRIALNAAAQGHRVLFVSLEMSLYDLEERITCMMSGLPMKKITNPETLSGQEKEQLRQADEQFAQLPFEMIARAGFCVEDLELMLRKETTKGAPYDVVVVDYIQILGSRHFDATKQMERLVHVSERIRVMANECHCHILALAQLNRESKRNTKPTMEHIKGSGQFEQDVYAIFLLDNAQEQGTPQYNTMRRIQLAKNRADGGTGEWEVEVDYARMYVGNVQHP